MSMLIIKNEKLTEALKKLRDLYPDDSLGDAIIMAVDRIKKAEERCKKLNSIASEAQERAYEFDKRYCDILVEKRQLEVENRQFKTIVDAYIEKAEELENSLKGNVNPTYMGYPVDPENPENCKVRLEELEK